LAGKVRREVDLSILALYESLGLAVWVEQEAADSAACFWKLVWVYPMHGVFLVNPLVVKLENFLAIRNLAQLLSWTLSCDIKSHM
jgi:hypothetical protein